MDPKDILPHYLECCAWAESGDEQSPLSRYAPEFSLDAQAVALERCTSFLHDNPDVALSGLTAEQVGHDLWLTSQGHGSGFWDRGLGELGQRLSKRAKLEHCEAYIGDSGLVELQ
jgi:hypothetical protein